jgi:hemerythrin
MSQHVETIEALIRREHGALDALFAELRETLARPAEADEAKAALARLRETLDCHLLQEERLYYTALRSLAPSHQGTLRGFVEAHESFRTRLAVLDTEILRTAATDARARLESIARDFEEHEAREEQLLREIDRELRAQARSLRS